MQDQSYDIQKLYPWNKGKLIGQKAPLKQQEVWAIRVRLELADRKRDLALFNLAIDSKLRGCDLTSLKVSDIRTGDQFQNRAKIVQRKTDNTVQFEITKAFVLAAGAIETVRLLMGAVGTRSKGLGNDRDLLGRFFMEHPHARGGEFIPSNLAQTLTALPRAIRHDGNRYAAYMRPADEMQRQQGILNSSISIAPRLREGEKMELFRSATSKFKHELPSSRFWRSSYHGLKKLAVKGLELTDPWSSILNMKLNREKMGVFAVVRAEQAPNPDSRIMLARETDRLGTPQVALNWQLSEIDKHSVKVLMETVGDEYRRLGWGDVKVSNWLSETSTRWNSDPLISSHPIGGYHHMGGTRMSSSPDTGVVDKNCRLHESPNLYVASSSVFPTGGWANPTATIIALSLRLADHLKSVLDEQPTPRSLHIYIDTQGWSAYTH